MRSRRICLLLVIVCAAVGLAATGARAGYTGHYYLASNGYNAGGTPEAGLPYWIYVPDNYDPAQSYPLFIYLHGSGNGGTNNLGPSSHPNASALRTVASNPLTPAFVIVPQSMNSWQHNSTASQALFELIDDELIVNQGYNIDTDRVYVTGFSLGGIGIFSWTGNEPSRFAAVCPFAGSLYFTQDNFLLAQNRATVATWAFSGGNDGTVTPASTEAALSAQAAEGGDPLMTTYAGAGHNDTWKRVRDEEVAVYWWMLAQRNGQPNDMSMFVGWETNTVETVTLNGPGESVVRTDPIFVGYYGVGTLQVLNGATMTSLAGYVAAQKYGRGHVIIDGPGSQWVNTGAVLVGSVNPAALHVANGGELITPIVDVGSLSYLTGNGTVTGNVTLNGVLRPGDVAVTLTGTTVPGTIGGRRPPPIPLSGPASLSGPDNAMGSPGSVTGEITIDGNLTQNISGTLEIELGGAAGGEYDAVEVTGHATLNGDVVITLVNGFDPNIGDTFVIVDAATRTGAFVNVDGLRIGAGKRLVLVEVGADIHLVTELGIPGDVDGNGSVSLADFVILKNNFGTTSGATWEDGDFDGDGDVDLDDFVLMKQNFGT